MKYNTIHNTKHQFISLFTVFGKFPREVLKGRFRGLPYDLRAFFKKCVRQGAVDQKINLSPFRAIFKQQPQKDGFEKHLGGGVMRDSDDPLPHGCAVCTHIADPALTAKRL